MLPHYKVAYVLVTFNAQVIEREGLETLGEEPPQVLFMRHHLELPIELLERDIGLEGVE